MQGMQKPKYEVPATDVAQRRFGNAKSISSDAFNPDRDERAPERQQRLQQFAGASAISSADYFGDRDGDGDGDIDLSDLSPAELINRMSIAVRRCVAFCRRSCVYACGYPVPPSRARRGARALSAACVPAGALARRRTGPGSAWRRSTRGRFLLSAPGAESLMSFATPSPVSAGASGYVQPEGDGSVCGAPAVRCVRMRARGKAASALRVSSSLESRRRQSVCVLCCVV